MRTISLTLVAALMTVCSCGGKGTGLGGSAGSGGGGTGPAPNETVIEVSPTLNRDVDILFLVDNSLGMKNLQAKLAQSFQAYANVLKNLPGGLPNLHLGVISSDLGAGVYDDIPRCRRGGDRGALQSTPRGTSCAAGSLMPGQRFISNVNGVANYTGSLEDTFGCIAALGDAGCSFEHQFGSLLRALGADGNGPEPADNANFLRPNAYLSIVIVTDEDDCSAPSDSTLFDLASRYVSDPLGPLTSYRCNEYGHLCAGKRPPRTVSSTVDLSGMCTSTEDGRLLKVADVAKALQGLKTDPSKVLVAAIAGPPVPYVVGSVPPTLTDDPTAWATVMHSCSTADLIGDPAIRIKALVDAFGGDGVFLSDCSDSFQPALMRVAEEVGKKMSAPCLGRVVDAKPATIELEPDCAAVIHTQGDAPLMSCLDGGAAPCWELGAAAASCPAGERPVRLMLPPAAGAASATLTCKICQADDPRPGCAYLR